MKFTKYITQAKFYLTLLKKRKDKDYKNYAKLNEEQKMKQCVYDICVNSDKNEGINLPIGLNDLSLFGDFEYFKTGRTTYYITSDLLINNLINSTGKITDVSKLFNFETFVINFPKTNNGLKLESVLVSIIPTDLKFLENKSNIIRKWATPQGKSLKPAGPTLVEPDSSGINLLMSVGSSTFTTPGSRISDILNKPGTVEIVNLLSDDGSLLSKDEQITHSLYVKLICNFLLYRRALPNKIVDGLPRKFEANVGQRRPVNESAFTIEYTAAPHATSDHYRNAHYRQLMNEKYYKGEYASKPIGSRVLYIEEQWVKRDIRAKTVKN